MRVLRISLLVAVGMAWAVSTAARVHVWGDERLVWMEAVQASPTQPRPWVNLGRQYALLGDRQLAAKAYMEAIRLATERPDLERRASVAFALVNLALLEWETAPLVADGRVFAATQLLPHDPTITTTYTWIHATAFP